MADFDQQLTLIKQEIARLQQTYGLSQQVAIAAVSKRQDKETIAAALAAGHRLFAENYVQEAAHKWSALKTAYPDCQLHLIGALQRNKVREALAVFDCIETLDRSSLAEALYKETLAVGRPCPPLLIQINIGEEPQKAGVLPSAFDALYQQAHGELGLPVQGVMAIPPADAQPAPYFALLQRYQQQYGLPILSMGMSGDWQQAVMLGSTQLRLGTALFGARQPTGQG